MSIRVELLGGRGEEMWPPPGRILAVGPAHTFADLAGAIDGAFARWDRAHLCQFRLCDGRTVTDEESAEEFAGSVAGPFGNAALILDRTKVLRTVKPGEEFCYVFDFGDGWTHRCTVEAEKIDPLDELGVVPQVPLPSWGWGSVPDQYGRRWADDSGEDPMPARPAHPDPMLTGQWPETVPAPAVDLPALRGATFRGDVGAILAAVEGSDVGECLQHVGAGIMVVLGKARGAASDRSGDRAEGLAVSVINRLNLRGWDGDDVLADELLDELRRTPRVARIVAVDLSEVSYWIEGDASEPGGYLDLRTGDVLPDFIDDPGMVGDDASVDLDEEPDRWLSLDRIGSRPGWVDMASFAAEVRDEPTRTRLESAIQGRGAFRRFRDEVEQAGLVDRWRTFSDDRRLGRAREYLSNRGVRAVTPGAS
jgi:hypothetical protein